MRHKVIKMRPPRIAIVLLATCGLLYWLIPSLRTYFWYCPGLGITIFTFGLGLMMWAWVTFKSLKNPICPTATAITLIRTGPFRYSRNPMYLGMLIMLISVFIWTGAPIFIAPPVLFFAIIQIFFIPFEEARLADIFKDEYMEYEVATGRWICLNKG